MQKPLSLAIALASVFSVGFAAFAQLGSGSGGYLPYQGRLELNGVAVEDPVELTFELFSAGSGGALLDSATHTVDPAAGAFSVRIGPLVDAVFLAPELWLQLKIAGAALGGRQRIQAVPLAVRSDGATGPYLPSYTRWSSVPVGAGGAAILNDDGSYQALMLVGNHSQGDGVRRVEVFDRLQVFGDVQARRAELEDVDVVATVNAGSVDTARLNASVVDADDVVANRVDTNELRLANGTKALIFGGWFCSRGIGTTAGGSTNPLTGDYTCPAGFDSRSMFATGGYQNCDTSFGTCQTIECHICFK